MRQLVLNENQTVTFDLPIMIRDGVEVMSSMDLAKMCGQAHSDGVPVKQVKWFRSAAESLTMEGK